MNPSARPPDAATVQSVRQRLTNLARQRREDVQRVLVRYALERLLYRLSLSRHAERFVLKGAMLFGAWTETLIDVAAAYLFFESLPAFHQR